MLEFNFIKNLHLHFGGDKKIEIARGKQGETVVVVSSSLEPNAIDISKNLSKIKYSKTKQLFLEKNKLKP